MVIFRFISVFLFLVLLPFSYSVAQDSQVTRSSIVELYKGKPYYMHFVKQGETIHSIAKAYQVSAEEIQAENPELHNGLKYDMVLRIPKLSDSEIKPIPAKTATETEKSGENNQKPLTYKVEKKETLYGISRKFDITVDQLLQANPEATHLKEGMVLIIPVKKNVEAAVVQKTEKQESTTPENNETEVVVKAGETLYSIAKRYHTTVDTLIALNPELVDGLKTNMLLRIKRRAKPSEAKPIPASNQLPVSEAVKPNIDQADCYKLSNADHTYNIALLLPFALDDVMEVSGEGDPAPKPTDKCFEHYPFYAGFKLAADSLQKYGLNAKIYVYDADKQNDTLQIKSVLRKPEMQKMNLIIGPLYAGSFPIAARFAKKHQIPIVNPLSQREILVSANPGVMKIQPASLAIADKLASHIAKNYKHCKIVAVSSDSKDFLPMLDRFENNISQLSKDQSFSGSFTKVNLVDAKMAGVIQALDAGSGNIVIYFSENKSSVPNFVSLLNAQKGNREVVLIGMEKWSDMELETDFLVSLHYEQIAYSNINYSSRQVKDFTNQFVSHYNAKPIATQNAFLGFDLGWFYLTSLMWYGSDFQNCLQYNPYKGLEYNFDFRYFKEGDGMQNASVRILKLDDYKLVEIE